MTTHEEKTITRETERLDEHRSQVCLSTYLSAFKAFRIHEGPRADRPPSGVLPPATGLRSCPGNPTLRSTKATMMSLNHGGGGSALRAALPVGPDLPCLQDPELFFAESPHDVDQAKALCQGCRARIACLTGALGRGEPWGVWGGELLMHGAIVPFKRSRGRPRKADVAA